MSASTIGGKVLDSSALIALVRGRLSALTWVDVSRTSGIPLYLPTLAIAEARALRTDAGPDLSDLLGHPWVVLGELDTTAAFAVEQLLDRASATDPGGPGVGVVDVLAGHAVHVARTRDWPVLTTDPTRLRRLDPDIDVEML